MKQTTFASWRLGKVEASSSSRDTFERWAALLAVIRPKQGAEPHADTAETWLYKSESMCCFTLLDLADDAMPDSTAILGFGYMLERNALTVWMMNVSNDMFSTRRALTT